MPFYAHTLDGQAPEKWVFAMDGVVLALTDFAKVSDCIKRLREPDPDLDSNWETNCPPFEMSTAAVKKRKLKRCLINKGNETVTNCNRLKMTTTDGKQRMTDVADTEQLLRLIQSVHVFTMLGEASTTEIAKKRDAQGFPKNHQAATAGGTIAGNAAWTASRIIRDLGTSAPAEPQPATPAA